ncbi:MAG: hypothetical protein ACLGGV_03460 [Bacteroidia bacterium]
MKKIFKSFCEKEKDVPVFLTYNWFNSVFSDDEWDVVISKKGEEIVGIWPFLISKKMGFKKILTPLMSPYQGPWIKYPEEQNDVNKKAFDKDIIGDLISQLPRFDEMRLNFHIGFRNWLPLYWNHFKETTRYTFVLKNITDHNNCFRGFKESLRREISKAEKCLTIESFEDIDFFYKKKCEYAKHTGANYKIPYERLIKVYNFIVSNKCGEMLAARDKDGNIHSIILYLMDNVSAYYLHGVTDSSFKTSGSMSLLLWESIKRSSKHVNMFNFEGSMNPSIERYFRSFGGEQIPYFEISKTNSNLLKLINFISE